MACPARFERATYALQALKMRLINSLDNDNKVLAFGVQQAPRSVARSGIGWLLLGVYRRLDGLVSNLSGKPTFLSVLLNDGWVAANDLDFNPSMQQLGQNVLPVFDSLVFF